MDVRLTATRLLQRTRRLAHERRHAVGEAEPIALLLLRFLLLAFVLRRSLRTLSGLRRVCPRISAGFARRTLLLVLLRLTLAALCAVLLTTRLVVARLFATLWPVLLWRTITARLICVPRLLLRPLLAITTV